MFKFEMIELVHPNAKLDIFTFGKVNYIYGPNAKGKTILFKIIDFMSGSSDSLLASEVEGLENVCGIIAKCKVSDGYIFLKRETTNLFLKYADEDQFEKVDLNTYKEIIMSYLSTNDNEELVNYRDIYSEQLTHRAFSFLNFIDEVGIGDISNVFTRSHTSKHTFRIKNVIDFLLNYDTILEKNQMKNEIEKLKSKIEDEMQKNYDYYNAIERTKTIFKKNNLNFTTDMEENYNTFLLFKEDFGKTSAEPIKKDLIKLLSISNKLSEQIRIQNQINVQSTMIIKRHEKIKRIIEDLGNIFTEGNLPYEEYINNLLLEHSKQDEILLAKNFSETIERLAAEKADVDEKIKQINRNLSVTNLKDKMVDISILEDLFNLFRKKTFSCAYLDTLKEKYQTLQSNLKKLKAQSMNNKNKIKIDKMISACYAEFGNNNFINEDFSKKGFSIVFNENGLSICGSYVNDVSKKFFLPGSLARMALWQVCTYIAFIEYILENRKNLPLMPILCIDSLNQPFDEVESNYIESLNLLLKILAKRNIQIFIFSTKYDTNVERLIEKYSVNKIDLSSGLNSCH